MLYFLICIIIFHILHCNNIQDWLRQSKCRWRHFVTRFYNFCQIQSLNLNNVCIFIIEVMENISLNLPKVSDIWISYLLFSVILIQINRIKYTAISTQKDKFDLTLFHVKCCKDTSFRIPIVICPNSLYFFVLT